MRRVLIIAVLIFVTAGSTAQARPHAFHPCTAETFRAQARAVYLPWNEPIANQARLRWLKHCAPNARTLRGMRKAERQIVAGRREARKLMLCGSPECNRRLGRYKLRERGELDQWPCLEALWTHESNWEDEAVNPTSGAAGIPQALGHGPVFSLGEPGPQIDWGLDYIKGRYGTPCAAWGFWLANNWY